MQRKKISKVSLSQIAAVAGVSKTTVSYVMRNFPGPARETREHVLKVAGKLGYSPDPRLSSWMAQVHKAKEKDLQPIIWLDTNGELEGWSKFKFLSPYLEGASARALELGYRIEIFRGLGDVMSMQRVSQIIYQRGVDAVIVTQFARHIHLQWDYLAAVGLEGNLITPQLDQVKTDYLYNLLLALTRLKLSGYRRIGIYLPADIVHNSYHAVKIAAQYFQASTPTADRVPPLFYQPKAWMERQKRELELESQVVAWVRCHRPDVIVGFHNQLEDWLKAAGFRVPEEIGLVHLATDDDVSDWAGICSMRRKIGATAVERVISLRQNHQFGIPATPVSMVIRGVWHPGRTLLIPKSK